MLAAFLDDIRGHDMIAPRRMAKRLRLSLTRLAKLAQTNRNTMAAKSGSPAVQARLGEIARIITRTAELSGGEGRAIIWFRHQPLPRFGKTPEQLVEESHAALLLRDLNRMAEGCIPDSSCRKAFYKSALSQLRSTPAWPFAMTYPIRSLRCPRWRMLTVHYQREPFSGEGARLHGGRWNPPGMAALYLVTDHATAIADLTDERSGACDDNVAQGIAVP